MKNQVKLTQIFLLTKIHPGVIDFLLFFFLFPYHVGAPKTAVSTLKFGAPKAGGSRLCTFKFAATVRLRGLFRIWQEVNTKKGYLQHLKGNMQNGRNVNNVEDNNE